jgi:hypothetical protein
MNVVPNVVHINATTFKFEYSRPCPTNDPNYHLINGRCIFVEKKMKNYEDAKKNCIEKFRGNGKLFEPKTWAENEMAQKVKKFVEQCFAI